ncbi:MAG: DUF2334 domain-containing protein [Candidatus Omnitrophica bacterium]|nr:DUF2334 domain-containing protein [Candidatus Omnitrophota bacterium]
MKEIFIRDDDVYRYSKIFLELFNFLKVHHLPVVYAVVPALADSLVIQILNKEKNRNPFLFDIVQHGWKHKNYSKNLLHKYEFGHLRSYRQQEKDIRMGYQVMSRLFANNFLPAFVPPYHGYNQDTLKIIKTMKIPVFSAGKPTGIVQEDFIDLPAQISLNDYTVYGRPISMEAKRMIAGFLNRLAQKNDQRIGMVFHHDAIKNKRQFNELKIFFLFLKKMEKEDLIKITLFSEILCKRKKAVP